MPSSHRWAPYPLIENEIMPKIFFEDLSDGQLLDCRAVSFSREGIIEFASRYDPQVFHIDEAAAEQSAFGGLIASSLHTLAACTRVVVDAQGDVAILTGIGMHAVKMFNPVRPGDVLHVHARWCELARSKSKPDRGLASIKCKVVNQHNDVVIEYGYRYLVACREDIGIA